jgi:hypothetical protein
VSDLRYPIGQCVFEPPTSAEQRRAWIDRLASQPERLRVAATGLSTEQLDTPYRPDGWTVRQVVHHVVDSHINAYVRMKLALTEKHPTIKPYEEARWAELSDYAMPVEGSLAMLELLHQRWTVLLRRLPVADFARGFVHPETGDTFSLDRALATYAWHGDHHIAHVTSLRKREGW